MPNTDMPSGSRAPPPQSIEGSSSSIVDVNSEHLKSIASDQASEAEEKGSEAAQKSKEKSSDYAQTTKEKTSDATRYAKEKANELADQAGTSYDKAKSSTSKNSKKAKEGAKGAGHELSENRDNPVVIANGVLIVAGSAALGYGAYTKHAAGELDWKVAGIWAGLVGAVAVGDYFLSQ